MTKEYLCELLFLENDERIKEDILLYCRKTYESKPCDGCLLHELYNHIDGMSMCFISLRNEIMPIKLCKVKKSLLIEMGEEYIREIKIKKILRE